MKQISARQFRTSFADLEEAVVVSRRSPDGTIVLLGEWRPIPQTEALTGLDARTVDSVFPKVPGFGHPSPAPKPGSKK